MSFLTALHRLRYARRPNGRIERAVTTVLTDLGFGNDFLIDDMADQIAGELANREAAHKLQESTRISDLLKANTREVERRRLAERVIGQIEAFVRSQDRCNPGTPYAPGLRAIFQSTGFREATATD